MLVTMIDDLLELLRSDQEFRSFTLDGQTVILEDYLEVRPEKREEIRKLIGEGRIVTGPWYVLPDEFLVSAESTVRNLMAGTRMASSFGKTMTVGYIPDSFGHIAMMPAILKGFGILTALVYRGFGGEPGEQTSEYWWKAPDGTRALLIHLFRHGYSAGYFHQETERQILDRFALLKEELDSRATTTHRLLMNGGDHHWPDPNIPGTLALLGRSFDGTFEQSTVERYAAAVRDEVGEIPVVEGELRFGLPVRLRRHGRRVLQPYADQTGELEIGDAPGTLRRATERARLRLGHAHALPHPAPGLADAHEESSARQHLRMLYRHRPQGDVDALQGGGRHWRIRRRFRA
jgi:hypothetical protein